MCPTVLIFTKRRDSFKFTFLVKMRASGYLMDPHLNPGEQVLSFSRSGREDNMWKQTTEKFRGALFPGPRVRCGLPVLCWEGDCLFVGHQDFKSPFLNSQKMNCNFLRDAGTILSKDEWKRAQSQMQKSQRPPNLPQGTCAVRLWDKASKEHVHLLLVNWTVLILLHGTKKICTKTGKYSKSQMA